MSDPRWYFTEEQLANSPSRKCGINAELELSYRQRAANLIQEMGQRLQVSQLCINTAIVYMHRFYAFHSFTMFHRNSIAAAAFFLAAKVEEQPRKLEHVIKILNICLEKTDSRDTYAEQAQELVLNENILLQTLGFDVAIDHPHTHVVKACQLFNIVTVSRELRQTCYFMASNSLHLTTMCLKYRPTVVAAFCIYIACKWSRWEIPDSSEGKAWYSYVDETVTLDTLKKLTDEYLQILDRSPSKFKSKMKAITSNGQAGLNQSPGMGDGPSTTHFKSNQHDKHHHHHHHHKSMSSSATNNMNVNANGNSRTSSSSSSSKAQMHQMSSNSSSSSQYNKLVPPSQSGMNAVPPAASSSNHNMHRQRPPSSSSQQPYPSSNNKPPLMDERSHQQQQRMMHQDGSFYNSSTHPPKPRTSTSNPPPPNNPQQQPPLPPLPQQPPQQQPRQPYMKLGINDQKQQHNLMGNSSKQIPPYPPPPTQGMDMHQKNMKQNSTDYHGRSNSMNPQMNQQIPNNPQKKPPWSQQQQQQQPSMSQQQSSMSQQQQQVPSHNQDSNKYQHLQKNLQMPNNVHDQSASNLMNSSKYNDMSSKQQQQQSQQQVTPQNDFWFNDKINEMSTKTATPPRQVKSLFSPSPEHDSSANEKTMFNMVADSLKRHSSDNVDSPKDDRKSSIQTKRDKGMLVNSSQNKPINPPLPMPIPSSQVDKKFSSKMDSILNSHPMDMKDSLDSSQMMKKRPYGSIKDEPIPGRENKIRKVDHVKLEPTVPSSLPVTPSHPPMSSKNPQQSHSNPPSIYGAPDQTIQPTKQPIETNPDIVKSLLQECFSSSKYDDFDADLKNPELPDDIFADTVVVPSSNNNNVKNSNNNIPSNQQPQLQTVTKQESIDDLLDIKEEKMDSSAGEGSRKDHKKKSKKKKEKHKHKKKHKSSDRDEKSDSSSIKIIFSKDSKSDSKSSPESYGGGLKIKIPINKDAAASLTPGSNKNDINPAPIKLKISKEKFGNFANNPINTSSSTSTSSHHHKSKKDKDREKSKSKSSKHHSSSDYQHST